MRDQTEETIQCPYCGEAIRILVDHSVLHQNYIEDCHVCCRPINIDVAIDGDSDVNIVATSDNE